MDNDLPLRKFIKLLGGKRGKVTVVGNQKKIVVYKHKPASKSIKRKHDEKKQNSRGK